MNDARDGTFGAYETSTLILIRGNIQTHTPFILSMAETSRLRAIYGADGQRLSACPGHTRQLVVPIHVLNSDYRYAERRSPFESEQHLCYFWAAML
jgi:hypothetical protein